MTARPPAVLSLREALALGNAADREPDATTLTVGLACGFTAVHLETFLRAYVVGARPGARAQVRAATYGDALAGIRELHGMSLDGAVVVVEWPDLDPRLSPRRASALAATTGDDVLETVRQRLASLAPALRQLGARCPVAIAMPSLALPAAVTARTGRMNPLTAQLHAATAGFAADVSTYPGVRLRDPQPLARDLRTDLAADLPHTIESTSRLARDSAELLFPPPPKKGLITDLDDTLWRGLVGEVGADAVRWDLDGGATHAMYQGMLAGLAERGVLLAVVSKNDDGPVATALARDDLVVPAQALHPVLASWGPKSDSVTAVLTAWNIAADDVVVVDDTPAELAEIQARHPAITTCWFPTSDPAATAALLDELRDLFWKDAAGEDDALRAASLRAGEAFDTERVQAQDHPAFLRSLDATITVAPVAPDESRPYELVQKTNQFNLDGARHEPAAWQRMVGEPDRVTVRASYRDRFGDLGTVSVLSGTRAGDTFTVDCWVLSCRAFSRAVEHELLAAVMAGAGVRRARLAFAPTARNAATARFVESVASQQDGGWTVTPEQLARTGLTGVHRVAGCETITR